MLGKIGKLMAAKKQVIQAKRKTLSAPAKGAVRQVVKSELNNKLETKYTANQQQNISFNSGISTYGEAYPGLPPVALGPAGDQAARTGYEISPTNAKIDLTVAIGDTINRSVAIRVDVYVLTRKANRFWPEVAGRAGVPQLFLSGTPGGTHTIGYSGSLAQRFLKMNLSEFTVLKKRSFVLGGNVGLPNGDTTAGNAPNMSVNGMCKNLSFRLKVLSTLKYNQDTTSSVALYPNNYAPFFFIGYTKVDGSAPDTVNQSIKASWLVSMEYKDA